MKSVVSDMCIRLFAGFAVLAMVVALLGSYTLEHKDAKVSKTYDLTCKAFIKNENIFTDDLGKRFMLMNATCLLEEVQ